VEQVRNLFKEWVEGPDAAKELREAPRSGPFYYPRYTYCVRVGKEALRSVVGSVTEPPEYDKLNSGYVELVQLVHEDFFDPAPPYEDEDEEEEGWEEVVVEEDENCIRIQLNCIGPEEYSCLFGRQGFELDRGLRGEDGVGVSGMIIMEVWS